MSKPLPPVPTLKVSERFSDEIQILPPSSQFDIEEPPDPTKRSKKGWPFRLAFFALATVAFASALDATSLSVALPIIAKELGGTTLESFCAGVSFLLTSILFQPVHTALSDIFGRKQILYCCIVLFGVGSLIIGFSRDMKTLIAGRAVQGVGGGGLEALSEIILTDITTLAERPLYLGILSFVWAAGSAFGPLIGGMFAELVSWRWIAWINLPILIFPVVLVPLFLRLKTIPESLRTKFAKVDWIGIALFIPGLTLFALAITWAGSLYRWTSAGTVVPLVFGILLLIAFGVYEGYSKTPLLPYWLFTVPTRWGALLGAFLHGLVLYTVVFYVPIYFEGSLGLEPISGAITALPLSVGVSISAVATAFAIEYIRRYTWAAWSGWLLSTVGMGLFILYDSHTSVPDRVGLQVVAALGLGILFPGLGIPVQAASDELQAGIAMGTFVFARQLGAVIGVALGSGIFANKFAAEIKNVNLPGPLKGLADGYAAISMIPTLKTLDLPRVEKLVILDVYTDATRTVWITMTVISGIGLLTCFAIRELTLERTETGRQAFEG
ncbi:uncharacterized protein CIMG_01211 [Coccidioides immitis RS]|uniref:Major facilitator superfamily (MFS) profile domain-containing protein n=3 Tax=Coccidioides immitis TaxID=5501 RepID=J3KIP5_COCIM|nr:uncharacterized protein CIMG_01211 [Coccidioides immitis RS]EAS35857.3 hypothetical protein CIMG_01211 [Coccidioides immitis RS]KMP01147.1 hypothetical protein CIRG_01287 [Coccidioides immitis RMSCC 2394]KMU83651.1 hypothetical protein CIHG_01434 [Coccidioides immitis H538.4]TPX25943.1 hypothetical protein DIZ76_011401 [Coccidioides immitis]